MIGLLAAVFVIQLLNTGLLAWVIWGVYQVEEQADDVEQNTRRLIRARFTPRK